jgi:hypothetical protein
MLPVGIKPMRINLQQIAELCVPIRCRSAHIHGHRLGCSGLQHPEPDPADNARWRVQRIVHGVQEARRLAGLGHAQPRKLSQASPSPSPSR